jgi:secreted Zn-dependent insulinase-like peptidase
MLTNTKRLGRYHDLSTRNNSNNNSSYQPHLSRLASFYRENDDKLSLNWDEPLFGHKSSSLQKLLAKANKTTERATKFLNNIKSSQLACANRAKSIPENATIRKEYIKCGKEFCELKHGPYYITFSAFCSGDIQGDI